MASFRRAAVIGTTGAGKTTTAGRIAACLGLPHVEMDALHWDANWTEAPLALFRERVTRALAGEAWVVDGNYSKARDLVWPRAQLVVWLDYPLPVILWRLLHRSLRRSLLREELWNGNRERLRNQFFSHDSLFLWALKSHRRLHAEIPAQLSRPEYAHLALVHLRLPAATEAWLASLPMRLNTERKSEAA